MSPVRTALVVAAALCAAIPFAPARAQDVYVPEALEEWREWVLEGRAYRDCPLYFDRAGASPADYACAWPAPLELEAGPDGGRFAQRWEVAAGTAWVPLPGDSDHWPDRVTANGDAVPVVLRDGVPSVRLTAGTWRLAGRFDWTERPAVLGVPPANGIVRLTVDGQAVTRPAWNRTGVFLGDRERQAEAADSISTSVYRLVSDDVPIRLSTRLVIDVAGVVREATFGPLLPEGYVPLALASALPVRLEADGRLRAQVRPGRWEVTLLGRAPGVEAAVPVPAGRENLPDEEIWSYASNDVLRVTAPSGASPVDPDQASVPGEWAGLPAFRVEPGDALAIEERSRGQTAVENELHLAREMWLDFDRDGFTVRDRISGEMRHGWRLDMRAPYALGSATEAGDNLLVTAGDDEGETGVEIRQAGLDLVSTARRPGRGTMAVTGWDERFTSVQTTLFLPPGNRLVAAPGADAAAGSWAGRWQLLDFFLVLIVTIAAWRLFGAATGCVALGALVLSFHETGAPAWLWLNLLVGAALLRVTPSGGRLQIAVRAYAGAGAALLLIALVPFVAGQLRIAIYPQLEPQYDAGYGGYPRQAATVPMSPPAAAPDAMLYDEQQSLLERELKSGEGIEEILVTGVPQPSRTDFPRYAPNAVVQTGPGIPDWQWNRSDLRWNGPVDASQTLRLVILPAWAVSLLRFAEVLLLLAFAGLVAAQVFRRQWRLPNWRPLPGAALVMLAALATGTDARAQVPTPELLGELERRLLRAPDCAPRCAEVSAAAIRVDGATVSILLAIDALEEVAVPLPGTTTGWRPDLVQVDGAATAEVLRGVDQRLWVRVLPGRHAVNLRGATGDADTLEIAFPAPPRVLDVVANGWTVAGVRDRRLLSGALQLSRQRAAGDPDAPERWESSRFPPFVEVERGIEMGLDWTATTTVRRVAPREGAVTLRIPLLPGESVLAEGLPVTDGEILVSLAPGQPAVSWQSRLPRTSPLVLTAAGGKPWSESWQVSAGSIWNVSFEGVPESIGGDAAGGVRRAEFHPRAGEVLNVTATRPEAVAGRTLAIDAVEVRIDQGDRSRNGTLSFDYRSTRGGQHVLRLPPEAELVRVAVDGEAEPLRIDAGSVTLEILPGEHDVEVEWRDATPAGLSTGVPSLDLGAPASNLELVLALPANRWLLLTRGPDLGPSVLYWSELAALVLFAWLLSRIDWTPLRFRHWLLLGLGFSTFSWGVLAVVAAWLLVVGARDRWRLAASRRVYNLVQALLVLLTLLALAAIVTSLPRGLLGSPEMHVAGNGSSRALLQWFADRSEALTPTAAAWSVPMWCYKVLILGWALWLSLALIQWLPWTWRVFARDGYFQSGNESGSGTRRDTGGAGD